MDYPILVLTLPGDEARREPLTRLLEAHGLASTLFMGVDGRGGFPEPLEVKVDRAGARVVLGRPMGDGELACALSHQAIYDHVLAKGLPGAVVLEDDAVIDARFAAFMKTGAYERADLILLDRANTRIFRRHGVELLSGTQGFPDAVPPFLTKGYSVSAKAARFLCDHSLPITQPADWPCDITRPGALAAVPCIVDHPRGETGPSHLRQDRMHQARRPGRFFAWAYWRRWWRKRLSERLPDDAGAR